MEDHDIEVDQLKDAMSRQMQDIERLIDEKRQLEQELENANAKERTYRNNENINLGNQTHMLRNRSNSPRMLHSQGTSAYMSQHQSQRDYSKQ